MDKRDFGDGEVHPKIHQVSLFLYIIKVIVRNRKELYKIHELANEIRTW